MSNLSQHFLDSLVANITLIESNKLIKDILTFFASIWNRHSKIVKHIANIYVLLKKKKRKEREKGKEKEGGEEREKKEEDRKGKRIEKKKNTRRYNKNKNKDTNLSAYKD